MKRFFNRERRVNDSRAKSWRTIARCVISDGALWAQPSVRCCDRVSPESCAPCCETRSPRISNIMRVGVIVFHVKCHTRSRRLVVNYTGLESPLFGVSLSLAFFSQLREGRKVLPERAKGYTRRTYGLLFALFRKKRLFRPGKSCLLNSYENADIGHFPKVLRLFILILRKIKFT